MGLTFANKITVGRILAVPFFIATMLYFSPERSSLRYFALGIFLFAVISDVIDGYIARTRNQKTRAGAILDPLADKILLISAFICLYVLRGNFGEVQLPMWLVVAVISRDIIILLGSMLIQMVRGDFNIAPTKWGKTTTFFQVFCVIGILLQWDFSPIIWYLAVIFTLISGVDYIRHGIKILNENNGYHS